MKEHLDIEPELIEGGGGIFDIAVDGDVIFCRHDADRFPEEQEIVDALRERCAAPGS